QRGEAPFEPTNTMAEGEGQDASTGEPLQALANRPLAALSATARRGAIRTPEKISGGRGGIRTHERLAPLPVFKTGAFNHSATLPCSAGFSSDITCEKTQVSLHWVKLRVTNSGQPEGYPTLAPAAQAPRPVQSTALPTLRTD